MLSFDEFHAVRNRERQRKKEARGSQRKGEPSSAKKVQFAEDDAPEEEEDQSELPSRLGLALDMVEVQMAFIAIAFLDVMAAIAQIGIRLSLIAAPAEGMRASVLLFVQAFSSFSVFFFGIELLATLIAFRASAFLHFGYLLEMALLAGTIVSESKGLGAEFRLLGVYRGWRIVRLVSYLIELERKAHANTKLEMESTQEALAAAQGTIKRLHAEMRLEKEAKSAVEANLQLYKDEVDTLNEALRIAATDIAEAGSADPHMFEGHGGEDDFEEALSSVQAPAISTHTFVVREDGSYDVL